ncbi:MAG: hypothetical protein J5930_10785 [Treponema sp.]|nr:hypothetical protein [Treponema sp.]
MSTRNPGKLSTVFLRLSPDRREGIAPAQVAEGTGLSLEEVGKLEDS